MIKKLLATAAAVANVMPAAHSPAPAFLLALMAGMLATRSGDEAAGA